MSNGEMKRIPRRTFDEGKPASSTKLMIFTVSFGADVFFAIRKKGKYYAKIVSMLLYYHFNFGVLLWILSLKSTILQSLTLHFNPKSGLKDFEPEIATARNSRPPYLRR
jgi:hypothetical protein